MRSTTVILSLALCATCAMALDQSEPLKAVSNSAESFSTDFVKTISGAFKGKNLISSPLSAHIVLSMAAYGAGGKTAQEMYQSLHLPEDNALGQQGFENLIDQLNSVENVTLEVANKMYIAEGMKLNPAFKQLTAGNFRSEASEMKVQEPVESAKLVNGWVKEKTHDKIQEIIKSDEITEDTRMILLNAVYFKGKWAQKFNKDFTKDMSFNVDENTVKQVPTMFNNAEYFYGELPDLKAKFIELPYENKDLKMVIILPDEINGLGNILGNLEHFNHSRLSRSGSMRDVQLYLPKFKIESTIQLNEPLMEMGMRDMFGNFANFTGIAEEPLSVSKVIQKAFIEVNEEGSEAAAVTVGELVLFSLPIPYEFVIDRPFYYEIVKRSNHEGAVTLFSGFVSEF